MEIDTLIEANFIYEIEHTEWVSPIVFVPKKNKKLRVCINLRKVNVAIIRDNYPLPITEHLLERVAEKETPQVEQTTKLSKSSEVTVGYMTLDP